MQWVYSGVVGRQPKYLDADFPKNVQCVSVYPRHFSNTEESLNLLDNTAVTYLALERFKLDIGKDQYAWPILNGFSGKMTKPVKKKKMFCQSVG